MLAFLYVYKLLDRGKCILQIFIYSPIFSYIVLKYSHLCFYPPQRTKHALTNILITIRRVHYQFHIDVRPTLLYCGDLNFLVAGYISQKKVCIYIPPKDVNLQ